MKKSTIIVHDGSYHTDDLFAVAALTLLLPPESVHIVRTRDKAAIEEGDYVVDVGGVYDEARHCFDHHQIEGAGVRENGIPYASFGLVWKFCGEKLCGSKEIVDVIDKKLAEPIDANDNGVSLAEYKFPDTQMYLLQDFLYAFRPTWKEETSLDSVFFELLETARKLIKREIKIATDEKEAEVFVRAAYEQSTDKRLIVLEKYWPWKDVIRAHTEPLFVVHPERSGNWCVQAVQDKPSSFINRKDFPAEWADKHDKELADISGVSDAIFCHKESFIAYARSREGAIALAKK